MQKSLCNLVDNKSVGIHPQVSMITLNTYINSNVINLTTDIVENRSYLWTQLLIRDSKPITKMGLADVCNVNTCILLCPSLQEECCQRTVFFPKPCTASEGMEHCFTGSKVSTQVTLFMVSVYIVVLSWNSFPLELYVQLPLVVLRASLAYLA